MYNHSLFTVTLDDDVFSTADIHMATRLVGQRITDDEQSLRLDSRCSLREMDGLINAIAGPQCSITWAAEVGAQAHLTSYGIIGFALLSSASLADALRLTQEFNLLLNLKFGFQQRTCGHQVVLELTNDLGLADNRKAFWLSMDVSKLLKLLSELNGGLQGVSRVEFDVDLNESEIAALTRIMGVPVMANAPATAVFLDAQRLNNPLIQSNNATHNTCKAACTAELKALLRPYDVSIQVQTHLLNAKGAMPSLADIADRLHLSPRTLRRRLDLLGTSYNALTNDVRKKIAIRFLMDTALTTEQIAEQLNYSDAANFRHAFKRWTGRSPREYRAAFRINKSPASTVGATHAQTRTQRIPNANNFRLNTMAMNLSYA